METTTITITVSASERAKKAWETIRARKAAREAGLPVPEKSSAPKKDEQAAKLAELLNGWLTPAPVEIPACAHGVALTAECGECVAAVAAAAEPPKKKRGRPRKVAAAA